MTKTKGVRLTERDYLILKYISEMDYVCYITIKRMFFNKCKSDFAMYKVCNRLVRAGLLEKSLQGDSTRYFKMSLVGVDLIHYKYTDRYFLSPPKGMSAVHLIHSIKLSQIRAEFESRLNVIKWKSDRYLAHDMGKSNRHSSSIPDALINIDGQYVILEYERTLKNKKRIREKLSNLSSQMRDLTNRYESSGVVICESENISKVYRALNLNRKIKIIDIKDIKHGSFINEFI